MCQPQVLACIEPGPDEIVLPKTSSSVFCSTNVDYILRRYTASSVPTSCIILSLHCCSYTDVCTCTHAAWESSS